MNFARGMSQINIVIVYAVYEFLVLFGATSLSECLILTVIAY